MTAVIDVRHTAHDDVVERAEHALSVRLDRTSVVYGESGASEGYRTTAGTWVRLERRNRERAGGQAWIGLEESATIPGVRKPSWFQSATWDDKARGVVWRADEVQLVTAPTVSSLDTALTLPDSWWAGLSSSLDQLAAYSTTRIGMSQQHVTRRITEVFGDGADTTVDEWSTAHTDVHWDNVTTDGYLIDWEDWGRAPRGLDAACLWQASLPVPELAERVRQVFAADLDTRSGKLAMLLQAANAVRAAARLGGPTPLSGPARAAADQLLAEL
nr:hypothetical protein [Saccharopolyspora sp. ASAGF58]